MFLALCTRPLNAVFSGMGPMQERRGNLRKAFALFYARYGLCGIFFPVMVPFVDTFVRSMVSMLLMDCCFSLESVALCYGCLHVSGLVGAVLFVWIFLQCTQKQCCYLVYIFFTFVCIYISEQ